MADEEHAPGSPFPPSWQKTDYDPTTMDLKGRAYLNVEGRRAWFIADQRHMIMAGIAKCAFVIQTELVELDLDRGYAQFKTYVRDVLGNECTMYGSETAKDFGDFAEKASTKSLGRALAGLGYSTASAQEFDEGERVVDSPQERKPQRHGQQTQQRRADIRHEDQDGSVKDSLSKLQLALREYGFLQVSQYHQFISEALGISEFAVADWEKRNLFKLEHVEKLRDAFRALQRKTEEAISAAATNAS